MRITEILKLVDTISDKILERYDSPYCGEQDGTEALLEFLAEFKHVLTIDITCSKCGRIIDGPCQECYKYSTIQKNGKEKILCDYCYSNTEQTCGCDENFD